MTSASIIEGSPALAETYRISDSVVASKVTGCIAGEHRADREACVEAIHRRSGRRVGPVRMRSMQGLRGPLTT